MAATRISPSLHTSGHVSPDAGRVALARLGSGSTPMSFKALFYAYILGGLTFIPLLLCALAAWSIYTSVPVGDMDPAKSEWKRREADAKQKQSEEQEDPPSLSSSDQSKSRKGWLTVRRTFEEKEADGSYVNMMRSFLDSRSKDPKRSRPKDMWYVVLKGNVLYLYENEAMTECEAAIQISAHEAIVYPEGLMDGELFTKRNAICLRPIASAASERMASVTKEMSFIPEDVDRRVGELDTSDTVRQKEKERLEEIVRIKAQAKEEAFDVTTPWFIFIRSCVDMEDWYLALVHAANYSSSSSILEPIQPVFLPSDMEHLVSTLDEQPDVIPMRWLNALIGRIFYSFYRTQNLKAFIIGRLMKKLSKVKTPSILQNISVTDVAVGNTPPAFSKPMLKELTKEGDAALEIRVMYKGEIRLTVEATAIINLGQHFKTYSVKLVLAVVLRKLEGNLLVKVKRPPTNRIWYAFTHPPEMDLEVEPGVSDRQIKWSVICSTIESRLKEIINESVVLPNMDDIAFFESSQYMHRGGIWADASRKAKTTSESHDEMKSSTSSASDTNVENSHKSLSADTILEGKDEDANAGISRADTVASPELASRRRTWVESMKNAGSSMLNQENNDDQPDPPEDARGRSPTVETGGRRATSVPAAKSASVEDFDGAEPSSASMQSRAINSSETSNAENNSQDFLPYSAHSRMRSLSSGTNVLSPTQGNSPRESLISRGSAPTNTPSFLSTLKSKADKQALSNTAKEAMRKWSANWNGFKRDHINGSNSGEETADGGMLSGNSLFTFPSRNRTYTDVRAAVSGRRERGDTPVEERSEGSSSAPIDIPSRRDVDENQSAISGGSPASSKEVNATGSSQPFRSNASPNSSPRGLSVLHRDSNRSAPSPPRVTIDTHSIDNTQPLPSPNFNLPPSAPPIKIQPSQGATMTIPGIHVSHRGDIMSYGYVPPTPHTPMTQSQEGKTRTATIPPTIQSVYRLFKSPTSNATVQPQQQHQPEFNATRSSATSMALAESPRQMGEPSQQSGEINNDVAPLALSPPLPNISADKTHASSKLNPPPLPPRSVPSPGPPSLPPRQETGLIPPPSASDATATDSAVLTPASSASEALKLIAEQDDTKRKDLEASPERWPRQNNSKRSSLGARRITSVATSDEPVSVREDFEMPTESIILRDGRASAASPHEQPEEAAERRSGPMGNMPTIRPPVISDEVRPRPPPLPPRRLSVPLSS
ncbi:hypothetical protein EW145_g1514 [Phellinidium pouzarii]|uniref:SMP-LTD domain-containing protein n=1 Tax=Phellinidium pouzarii TaxID=167371 RepID=A0A4S4LG34_9AGAM|nr:hypothetical protein EW145_g1514 [Phellinidium pouzarii]